MITTAELRSIKAFAQVTDEHLERSLIRTAEVELDKGDWLIHEGDTAAFYGVISGRVSVLKTIGGHEFVITEYGPGDSFGEVPLLLGTAAVASIRAAEPTRVARLEPTMFHYLTDAEPTFARHVFRALAVRVRDITRHTLEEHATAAVVVGHRSDLVCHDLRDFLARNLIAYAWITPEEAYTEKILDANEYPESAMPVVVIQTAKDPKILREPSMREMAVELGLRTAPSRKDFDLAIVGAGPAGLAAAVYGASEGLRTVAIEREAPGGQAGTSSRIENYLGFPNGISGSELGSRALEQAQRFGAELVLTREVTALRTDPECHTLELDGGETLCAAAILIAIGVSYRKLDVPGADTLLGRGVFYGAARTEAMTMLGKKIYLIGGGNSAGQAAVFFSDYAEHVTIVCRGKQIEDTMSAYLIEQLHHKRNVDIQMRSQIVAFRGEGELHEIDVKDDAAGTVERRPADAVFVFIGADANTDWLPPEIARDEHGYIFTGPDVRDNDEIMRAWPERDRYPSRLETSVPGVYAAGDVRHASIKRVASGVGEGSMCVSLVHDFLASRRRAPVA